MKESIIGAPNRFEARVTLHAAADEIASRVRAYWGTIQRMDAHTCEYRTGGDDPGEGLGPTLLGAGKSTPPLRCGPSASAARARARP